MAGLVDLLVAGAIQREMLENNTNLARKQRQHFLVQVRRHRLAERTGKVAENHEIPIRQIGAPFLPNRIVGSNGNGLRIANLSKA